MLENINLQHVAVIDIETVPQYGSYKDLPTPFQELWEQKSQYKRQQETAEEYYPRAGIWAEFGKIVCISVGMFYKSKTQNGFHVKSFYGHDEYEILKDFTDLLKKQSSSVILCAHNGKEFDFPYLCRRILINNLAIPSHLAISGKKPWEINHIDTMELWKFGDHKNYTSLNLLAAVFGITTPKDDITGNDVYDVYWKEKNLGRIKIYCQKDVVTTAQLLLHFKGLPALQDDMISIVDYP